MWQECGRTASSDRSRPTTAARLSRSGHSANNGQQYSLSVVAVVLRIWCVCAVQRPTLALLRGRRVARTVAAISDAAVLVLSSTVGHRCAYVLNVVVAEVWPMARWTVTTSHPAAMSPLA